MRPGVAQRAFYRLPAGQPACYRIVSAGGATTTHLGAAVNLSAGGMLLAVEAHPDELIAELLDETAELCVELALEGWPAAIAIATRLIWVERAQGGDPRQRRFGLRFAGLAAEKRQRIHDWVLARTR